MLTATQKMEKIIEALEAGKTITFANYLTQIKVTPKTYRQFVAAGEKLFAADDSHLMIRKGNRFDSLNGCKVFVS